MSIRKIIAIFKKQIKDTLKNKTVLIQFIMFPFLTIILTNAMPVSEMPENYFVTLFATMYIAMVPLTCMAAIIAEEKEKKTLRVLMMSNVKAWEYLIGVGSYILAICLLGSLVFGAVGHYQGMKLLQFMIIMLIGIVSSTLIGASIGIWSKNQMSASSLTVPVMLILSFLPMISMFNEKVAKVSKFIYSQQIINLMNQINSSSLNQESIRIIAVNILLVVIVFIFAYKRCGLDA
ncbi:MAG: ABC transporter permease [Lachnotalea sp.]